MRTGDASRSILARQPVRASLLFALFFACVFSCRNIRKHARTCNMVPQRADRNSGGPLDTLSKTLRDARESTGELDDRPKCLKLHGWCRATFGAYSLKR